MSRNSKLTRWDSNVDRVMGLVSRRLWGLIVLIPFAANTPLLIGADLEQQTDRPNVLLLICDDLNCDLGCYGHPMVASPHIDRLARHGVRFEQAYCQYPLCGPSRASFMTGLYPDQTLVHRNAMFVRHHLPNVVTLSQRFREHGYFVVRIGKIYHYGVPRNIGSGGHDDPYSWDYAVNPRGRDKDDEPQIVTLKPREYGGTMSWLAAEGTDLEQTDGIAATEAIELLERFAASDQSFFLAVGLYRPHTPYVAPKSYYARYDRNAIELPEVPAGYLETLPQPARHSLTRKVQHRDLSTEIARQAIQAYYASVTFADAQIGRILDSLEQTGLVDNTIVVMTSDHGYHLGEHGHYLKTTLFENATRVPLIISDPRVPQHHGSSTRGIAEMVDFYPTLMELCRLPAPEYLQGVSLASQIRDPDQSPRRSALTQYENGYSLRTARYRYTEWGDEGALGAELYDREDDPAEMHNLAGDPQFVEIERRLSRRLRRRIERAQSAPPGVEQRQ